MKRRITKHELRQVCRFCHPPDRDRILFKTGDFYVMLSLGPIVQGHLLVIPTEHLECCAEFKGEIAKQFDVLMEKVKSILCKEYGSVLLFEHGRSGSSLLHYSSAKHDFHAHMHCVPIDVDIEEDLRRDFPPIVLSGWKHFRSLYQNEHKDYLFIDHDDRKIIFFVDKELRSQYLRYLIANRVGVNEKYVDWMRSPGWRNIWKAKKKLLSYFIQST